MRIIVLLAHQVPAGYKKDVKTSVSSLAENKGEEGPKKGSGRSIKGMRRPCKGVKSRKKKKIVIV